MARARIRVAVNAFEEVWISPDLEAAAIKTVLQQAEVFSENGQWLESTKS